MNYQGRLLNGKSVQIKVENGRIDSLLPLDTGDLDSLPIIAPGLIDIQVNGFSGIDYNTLPLTEDGVKESMHALFREGVTTFLPTIITNSENVISEILQSFEEIRDKDSVFKDAVPGYHIEGPFISGNDGPRGAHNQRYVCPPSVEYLKNWQKAAGNNIKIITMSPEWKGSIPFIEYCVKEGIHVSIGHTSASAGQIREAAAAGADLSTHLGNGCHLEMDRHDNYIWQQLSEDGLWASIIADGFHLPTAVLKVFLKVKGDRIILISDVTSFGGLPPGKYKTHIGGEVILTEKGKLYLAGNEKLLAGSAKSILYGVNNLVRTGLLPILQAWEAASLNPSRYLPLSDCGKIAVGKRADFVILEEMNKELIPYLTVLNGKIVYRR